MSTLLWWGRSDPDYSRNRTILTLLEKMKWKVRFFYPLSSKLGNVQAILQRPEKPDLVWVPCFRQRDMHSAVYWARKWGCPLIFDPLISAYQKEVFEKEKWPEGDKRAAKLCRWEANLYEQADFIIADTHLHRKYYTEIFGIDPDKVMVIHVGADEQLFQPQPLPNMGGRVEVLFYGSFLKLHGSEAIVDAASMLDDQRIQWVLMGEGDAKSRIQQRARNLRNVHFEPWIDYDRLPQRISRAHILLGVFGTTPKASMVIPNKVFQAMAMGRPLVTLPSKAYPQCVRESDVIGWVPPGDPQALAACVRHWVRQPDTLPERGSQTRTIYERYFSMEKLIKELKNVLEIAMAGGGC